MLDPQRWWVEREIMRRRFPWISPFETTSGYIGFFGHLRGPQSGIHGSDANAGVIAITTISGRGQKPSADVKLEGGMERSREIAASARTSFGPIYASVSAVLGVGPSLSSGRRGWRMSFRDQPSARTSATARAANCTGWDVHRLCSAWGIRMRT